jgi:hypothetical protein
MATGPVREIQSFDRLRRDRPVEVSRVKIRDRGATSEDERIRFSSSILPLGARRTKSLDALLPMLYFLKDRLKAVFLFVSLPF